MFEVLLESTAGHPTKTTLNKAPPGKTRARKSPLTGLYMFAPSQLNYHSFALDWVVFFRCDPYIHVRRGTLSLLDSHIDAHRDTEPHYNPTMIALEISPLNPSPMQASSDGHRLSLTFERQVSPNDRCSVVKIYWRPHWLRLLGCSSQRGFLCPHERKGDILKLDPWTRGQTP